MFEVGKKYKDGRGFDVEIVAVDFKGPYGDTIVGICEDEYNPGKETVRSYMSNGQFSKHKKTSSDLIPPKVKRWINIYPNTAVPYETKHKADLMASADRLACIEIEYHEGQGVD